MRPSPKLQLNATIGRAQFGAAVFLLCTALACSSSSNAEEAAKQEAREKQFQEMMSEVVLDGYFTIDLSLSKAFRLGVADHRLRFRWDVFNLTNTVKFDVAQLNNIPDRAGFGRYDGSLATCDAQAGRCMQFALRYEF